MHEKIAYEQPLNERIRTFLRLEFLFKQAGYQLREGTSVWDARAALATLLEVLNILTRGDLKTEIMKELERHTANLARLEQNPEVDRRRFKQVLDDLERLIDRLHDTDGQFGQHLRQNEFLNSIKQRSAIPGGSCDFDLPAYHYWLQRPGEDRIRDLLTWFSPLDCLQQSIDLILRLTRQSAMPTREVAVSGFFQKALESNLPCQMIRVVLPATVPCFAEISGGRHRFTVRFLQQPRPDVRAVQSTQDVVFELTCCII